MKKIDFGKRYILVLFFLVFLLFLVYSPHIRVWLPLHLDEWMHLSKAAKIKAYGFDYDFMHSYIEVGFDLVIFCLSYITDPVFIYQFLPAANALLVGLLLFFIMKKKFNFWVGLFSIIFLASLKSNANILGLWFYVPFTAAIALDYLCLFYLDETVRENRPKELFIFIFLLFLLAFIHQSSFLVILLVSVVYLAINYKFVIKDKYYFIPLIILLIPALLMAAWFSNNFQDITDFLTRFSWGPLKYTQFNFNPFLLYGIIGSVFAAIGYYFCFKEKKLLPFRIYALIPLVSIYLFYFTDFTIFSSYQRYLYHFMIAAVPLSAVGFYHCIRIIKEFFVRHKKSFAKPAMVLFASISIMVIFFNYFDTPWNSRVYVSVYPNEYEALKTLKDYPSGCVLADFRIGAAMEAINGHCTPLTFFTEGKREDYSLFNSGNCSTKEKMIKERSLGEFRYVHSKQEIKCNFTEEVYNKDNNLIYLIS
jgi:hypothetical protein